MTTAQITQILDNEGYSMDQWITLENSFSYIGLVGENNLIIAPRCVQFYFSSTEKSMFIRYTYKSPFRALDSSLVEVSVGGSNLYLKPEVGGKIISDTDGSGNQIGVVHTIVFYNTICGFYK